MRSYNLPLLFTALLLTTLLSACASGGSDSLSTSEHRSAGKAIACKSGDKIVADSSMCLQDDAACYQLTNGAWCTGPRGMTCPTGSRALKKGEPCPRGNKCFSSGPNLNCVIDLH